MSRMRSSLLAAAALLVAAPALAAPAVSKGPITVSRAEVRASLGRAPNTAAYAVIRNGGYGPNRLVAASCACATRIELHSVRVLNGVAEMRPAPTLSIPAGSELALRPGGQHLMIFGLKAPLQAGSTVKLTLRFEHGLRVDVPFTVTSQPGAAADPHAGHR